ncbi:MAG TPA: hypothetical protein VGJ92_00470 [Methanocella sp.]
MPFKPSEGRPAYGQDCFPKHRKPGHFAGQIGAKSENAKSLIFE